MGEPPLATSTLNHTEKNRRQNPSRIFRDAASEIFTPFAPLMAKRPSAVGCTLIYLSLLILGDRSLRRDVFHLH